MAGQLAHWLDAKERHPDEITPERFRAHVLTFQPDGGEPGAVMDATAAIIQELEQARASEQTDRYDITIDRYSVLRDTLGQAFAPELLAVAQEQTHQAEPCERCGNESPGPLVAMAADWGDGAALYAGVCSGCVQEHDAYWAQRTRRDGDAGS